MRLLCYIVKFYPQVDNHEGVPLEHLVSCVRGVAIQQSVSGIKQLILVGITPPHQGFIGTTFTGRTEEVNKVLSLNKKEHSSIKFFIGFCFTYSYLGLAEKPKIWLFWIWTDLCKTGFKQTKKIQMFKNGVQQIRAILEFSRWNLNRHRHSKMLDFRRYKYLISNNNY